MRTAEGQRYPLPEYQTPGAAGLDLVACVQDAVTLPPGQRHLFPTGIAIALPVELEAQVRPRSGLAFKKGISIVNAPGTVDADYRGEIGVLLVNLGQEPVTIQPGERIAQLVIAPVIHITWDEVAALDATDRGQGGFGSTGADTHGGVK